MALELRQNLKLAQKLVMTPQLRQAIKLLQLGRLELGQGLLEHGVLLDLRLQGLGQLEAAELQQLDRLAQLRRHHQLLGQLQVLSEFKRHGLHPDPLHAAGHRRHMWKLSPRYILRATTLSMMSAATPLVRIWPLFMM